MSAEVDGEAVPNLKEEFLVQSPVFGYTIPADNLLKAVSGTNIPEGTHFPSVQDGVFVILSPLPAGRHVFKFNVDPLYQVTYNLVVGE